MLLQTCAFLLFASFANANYAVSVMHRRQYPFKYEHVANGFFLQEDLLVTAVYPPALFPWSRLCVLVDTTRYESRKRERLKKNCLAVKGFLPENFTYYPPVVNYVTLELWRNYRHIFGINVPVDEVVDEDDIIPENCEVTFNIRGKHHRVYALSTQIHVNAIQLDKNKQYLLVSLKAVENTTICVTDSGMPLSCQGVVVGILYYYISPFCEYAHVYACIAACKTYYKDQEFVLNYTYLFNDVVDTYKKAALKEVK